MSRLDDLKSKVSELVDSLKQSETFQQIRAKYDELDNDAKLYINLGRHCGGYLSCGDQHFIGHFKSKYVEV
jgi:hypothetical protein